ncbi:hypothetical protein HMPREF9442_01447 [Paraprevotella xylaniphila YIT 11841]|uniref:TonB-dependent receptor n=2 Tax=Paraprevotella xylaniphila TaxID=454155 RepID=F3QTD0_9BACT|nr:hypothetical protein HMPREF9442_01447 [Paraprevotella xylaniphila YIT 11841]
MKISLKPMALCGAGLLAFVANAQESGRKVVLHGSVQSDVLIPEEDEKIGTGTYSDWGLTNTYADLNLMSKYVDAGARLEFTEFPLPGFEPDFKGWGVPHIYVKGKLKGVDITAGDFYDQFGSGFVFRTYEERSLGIDNSLRGARVNVTGLKGVSFKVLGGLQRRYWDWSKDSWVGGADLELNLEQYSARMRDKNITWMVGGSYVLKHEKDEDIVVPGTNYRLNLPEMVSAFDVRSRFQKGDYSLLAEYAWKSQDPSFDNGYIYHRGNALMLSGSYSRRGMSALLQVKRSEDMAYRSQRSMNGNSVFINNMPAFAYQHTYALAALYPYATQAAGGEWAFQGEVGYNFARRTPLGGKYGTKLKVNFSHVRSLDKEDVDAAVGTSLYGTKGYKSKFFKVGGETYYQDINVQMEKKLTKAFKLNLMYMNQRFNDAVIRQEDNGMIKSHIAVAEGKYQFNNKLTLRAEAQYLATKQDEGDWTYGLLELSVLPYFMFTVSDMWNNGESNVHYYMGSVTFNYKAHRLMAGYGRTRAGYNCSGGVCRYVPATRGFQMSYNFNF